VILKNTFNEADYFWKQLLYSDLGSEIAAVGVPYLALVGSEDKIVPAGVSGRYAVAIQKANPLFQFKVVQGIVGCNEIPSYAVDQA
jgi:fermentation-respiration switch protein FrsA (DUF1100 family)